MTGTPCHAACWRGHPDAIAVLLEHGADPNLADVHGVTPCMIAAKYNGSVPILHALVAGGPGGALAGDAVNAVDGEYGRTALDNALANRNHAEFAAVLRDELGGKRAADL